MASGFTVQLTPKQPWIGTREQVRQLITAVEQRLAKLTGNSTIDLTMTVTEALTSYPVDPSSLDKLRTSTKALRADGHSLDVNGTLLGQIVAEWDRDGIAFTATSADSDWVEGAIQDLKKEVRESQSRWLLARSRLIRVAACAAGAADAAGLGLLVAYGLGELSAGKPNFAAGAAVAAIALIAFLTAGLRLRLFEITRENSAGYYLLFLRILVIALLCGTSLQVLVNLAT